MEKIEVGQEREFIERAHLDGRVIEKGTRVRVGLVTEELLEANVMVIRNGTARDIDDGEAPADGP